MYKCYAFKINNNDALINSSSGGAFTVISDLILDKGGVIVGAVYDYQTNKVIHVVADNRSDRNCMRGSKYIQSDLGNIYNTVENCLRNGVQVLFTGTICQIVGLKNYIKAKGIDESKLITCDIICHGVASPLIWEDYISMKKKEFELEDIDNLSFRDKEFGWSASHSVLIKNGKKYEIPEFMKLFYGHTIMRPSCHECRFTSIKRNSDITIGDFWGIEKSLPKFNCSGGVSFVMTSSENGDATFSKAVQGIPSENVSLCEVSDVRQPNFHRPTPKSIIRTRVWNDYRRKGISYIINEYTSVNKYIRVKVLVKKVIDTLKEKLTNDKKVVISQLDK